jgi:DNA-binding MarR family transcriptional regulator
MSHQDIADHLGLTIETVSRTITNLERSQLVPSNTGAAEPLVTVPYKKLRLFSG